MTDTWWHNPVSGEYANLLVSASETDGQRVEFDLWLQRGAAVGGEHQHPFFDEYYKIREGRVGFELDSEQRILEAGEEISIPAGHRHFWWNVEEPSVMLTKVSCLPGQPGTAHRFIEAMEVVCTLATRGQLGQKGLSAMMWGSGWLTEYSDAGAPVNPPAALKLMQRPMALLARATGRDVRSPEMHGDACPALIPAPDEASLREMLEVVAPAGALFAAQRGDRSTVASPQ